MHWTTHIITGAVAGLFLERRVPAVLAGLGGHAVLDVFPHRDPESEAGYLLDSALGTAALLWLARGRLPRELPAHPAVMAGALSAAAPDLEILEKLFRYQNEEEYLFPSHNGILPHYQCGPRASALTQSFLVLFCLAAAALKLNRGFPGAVREYPGPGVSGGSP